MTGRPFGMAEIADQGSCKDCGAMISVPTRRADGSFYWQCASCAESADSAETPSRVAASLDSRDLFALPALSAQEQERKWPTLDPAAHHGLAGKVIATLGPHTEADPVALLLSFLVAFGNAANPAQGLGPRALVGATAHPARLNVLLVGETARARKGTAQGEVNRLMHYAAPEWYATRVMGGLASGESIAHFRADRGGHDCLNSVGQSSALTARGVSVSATSS